MGKLDVTKFRYMNTEQFRVLTAVNIDSLFIVLYTLHVC